MITQMVVCWILLILKKNCRLIAAGLRKQKALDSDPKSIQQIIFTVETDNQIRDNKRSNKSFLINVNG